MTATSRRVASAVRIPKNRSEVELRVGRRTAALTNLHKVFFPEAGLTKRDLLQYYADVAPLLLPHLRDRAIVMKRYPNGIKGKWFFMKRAPSPRPDWIETCEIMHKGRNLIAFPMVQDLASLLWIINLGCIDLNPWYARCDDVNRPDFLNFDLDPAKGARFAEVLETGIVVRDALEELGMRPMVKTSGSEGLHLYVAIVRGPTQREVWGFAKRLAKRLEQEHPGLVTAEFLVADRPRGRVLVDYNQNAWGRTLASVYSVRPNAAAGVSTPVTWEEVERGFEVADFRLDNVPARVRRLGDLWKPLLSNRGRFRLEEVL
jgi:bifunctional non-homologous end joining protein LigD